MGENKMSYKNCIDGFTHEELTIGNGLETVTSLPFEAPWLSPLGVGLIMITDIRRNENNIVEFQLGNEEAIPYEDGNAWAEADDFYCEWPD